MRSTIEEKAIAHDRVIEAIDKLLALPHDFDLNSLDYRERGVRHELYKIKYRHIRARTKWRDQNGETE